MRKMMNMSLLLTGIILTGCAATSRMAEQKVQPPPSTDSAGLDRGVTYDPPPKEFNGLPLLYVDDFDYSDKSKWKLASPEMWALNKDGERTVLAFLAKRGNESQYMPSYRSPMSRGILDNIRVTDFVYDVWLRSTCVNYAHRDMCLFFGFRNSQEFYYVHLGLIEDDVSNRIHIVNNADRTSITKKRSPGTPWTDGYHHARIIRDASTGLIEVYFDDMSTPIMTAEDKTFTSGRVGVGSFDDCGNIDRIVLWGRLAK